MDLAFKNAHIKIPEAQAKEIAGKLLLENNMRLAGIPIKDKNFIAQVNLVETLIR